MKSIRKHIFPNLSKRELNLFRRLNTPKKIQNFLEKVPINFDHHRDTCVSPRVMLKKNKAHCIEAAFFAAAVLWFHGYKPLLLDLQATDDDYDHVVALFHRNGCWGAISKTNHAVLRYREPVYRNIRELAMSYFHEYFDDNGKKNMRAYSQPFNLARLGKKWIISEKDLWHVAQALDDSPHHKILTKVMIAGLRRADKVEIRAGKIVQWKK
ncbi:MAG: hypothetical protein HYT65_03415 [Candidatus Yanofskybacteria bacterium]|nr:hypothetical protein [Candidatus Yanofskybacteria bacterium]